MSKFSFHHTYRYPWELVTHTHLTKYPTEKEKNIVGIECIESRRGADNLIVMKMIVTCLNIVPSIFRKLAILDVPYIKYEEECVIDINQRMMIATSTPVGFQDYTVLNETSTFTPDPTNPNWTLFAQEGTIEIKGLGSMSWLIELFARKFLTRGAKKNTLLMEELMNEKLSAFNRDQIDFNFAHKT